jgi:hypothetical protein
MLAHVWRVAAAEVEAGNTTAGKNRTREAMSRKYSKRAI